MNTFLRLRCCLAFPVVLAMAVGLWGSPAAATSTAASGCPNPGPQPLASVDLQAYLGKWYEIGASAGFKFLTESGLTCIQAEYTLLNETDSGPNIRVVNSGLTLAGREVGPLVRAFSGNSTQLCSLLNTFAHVEGAMKKDVLSIGQAVHKLAKASGYDSRKLLHLSEKLGTNLRSLARAASEASRAMEGLQLAVGAAQQVPGGARLARIERAVHDVDCLVSRIASRAANVQMILGLIVGEVEIAEKDKQSSVSSAAKELAPLVEKLRGQLQAWLSRGSALHSSFAAVVKAAIAIGKAGEQAAPARFPFAGAATRNPRIPNREGALLVQFPFSPPADYWIIALEGKAKDGYKAALIYSCDDQHLPQTGEEQLSLWILSRTPKLDQAVIDRLLSTAEQKGVILSCSNAFIPTVQSAKVCNY